MTNLHINTPLIEAPGMSHSANTKVWLKMDALQPSGSFKNRGVGFACQTHKQRGAKALVSSSGGNAGLAVAYAGRQLGMAVTVVVPQTTKQRAIDLMNQQGANVIITGKIWDEAHEHAMTLVNEQTAYIHPFDDPLLWQGHASIIDEVVEAGVNPDAVVLSVGGGGLLCGVIEGLKRNGLNNTPVIAVETQGAHSLSKAMTTQQHVGIDNIDSIATSLGAKLVAKQAFELSQDYPITSQVVSDKQAVDACCRFVDDHRVLVEPACGASLAVAYEGCEALKDKHNILVIVCGGVGVSLAQLRQWQG